MFFREGFVMTIHDYRSCFLQRNNLPILFENKRKVVCLRHYKEKTTSTIIAPSILKLSYHKSFARVCGTTLAGQRECKALRVRLEWQPFRDKKKYS